MSRNEHLSDEEINRYVDGELPAYRRIEIEAMLAANPSLAARAMADIHVMDALRDAQPRRMAPPPGSLLAARRIERKLRIRRLTDMIRRRAVAATFTVAVITAVATRLFGFGDGAALDEDFVADVQGAHQIAMLDAGSGIVEEGAETKLDRLENAIDVVVPDLPPTWDVQDVSVQSLAGKESVVVTVDAASLGEVTLVASPVEETEEVPPRAATDEGPVSTVVWQSGGTAYALVGSASPQRLITAANGIEAEIW